MPQKLLTFSGCGSEVELILTRRACFQTSTIIQDMTICLLHRDKISSVPEEPGVGGIPRKIRWRCAARFPKLLPKSRFSLPYLESKQNIGYHFKT